MDKEKQIEEMAVDLCLLDDCKHLPKEECDLTTCVHCMAEILYKKGYRKVEEDSFRRCTCLALGCDIADDLKRDVAREIFEEIEASAKVKYWRGGGLVVFEVNGEDFAELKKKYTEEGKG